jgi:tRNA pseudouridine38-40 synthase
VVVDVQANAFLKHMVRNIVGALVSVGRGGRSRDYLGDLLALRDRTLADVTAPGCGLHFVDSLYDEAWGLPREPLGPNLLAFLGEWTGERPLPDCPLVEFRRGRPVAEDEGRLSLPEYPGKPGKAVAPTPEGESS